MIALVFIALAVIAFASCLFTTALAMKNLALFRQLDDDLPAPAPRVSLLIPARNESGAIAAAVLSGLSSVGVDLELIVLDDGSTDETAAIVRAIAARDPRVRVESAPALPEGWCGKQHACWKLAGLGRGDLLAWIDADVRLAPTALARMARRVQSSEIALLSGFPRQITKTFLESLLLPLIHFVLLSFLPIAQMRRSRHPAFGAGCGQLFMARRDAYFACGGHASIKQSLHDGIMLPRAFRRAGFATDVFDASDAAVCRMYRSAAQVWRGLLKNAGEGMAAPGMIWFWTIILSISQLAPPAIAIGARSSKLAQFLAGAAWWLFTASRVRMVVRFRQPVWSALLHPLAILLLLLIQWQAAIMRALRLPAAWRGRTYPTAASGNVHCAR